MIWFDGICHAMCALFTGGFSAKLNSIGKYYTLSQLIGMFGMIMGRLEISIVLTA